MKKNFRLPWLQFPLLFLLVLNFGCSKYNQPLSEADNGMHFYVMEGGAVVSGFGHDREVTVPSEVKIDGETYTVTGIGGLSCNKDVKILHLPPTIKKISRSAFEINELEAVYLEDLSAWCNIDFDYEWNSGNTFISYSSNASPFRKETKLYVNNEPVDTLVIPDNTGKIGDFAFNNLNCEKIVIGSGVDIVGNLAFSGSTVREVVLGPDITDIYQETFSDCENLKTLRLSEGMHTLIGYEAFKGSNPSEIHSPDWDSWLNLRYAWQQLGGGYIGPQISDNYDLYIGGEKMVDVVIPAVKEVLNSFCFAGANIRSAVFEEGITYTGGYPFWGCSKLESVTIPSTMVYCGCAFINCNSLKEVYVKGQTPPLYDSNIVFNNIYPALILGSLQYNEVVTEQCVLYVPKECVAIYAQSPGWGSFKEIFPIPNAGVNE